MLVVWGRYGFTVYWFHSHILIASFLPDPSWSSGYWWSWWFSEYPSTTALWISKIWSRAGISVQYSVLCDMLFLHTWPGYMISQKSFDARTFIILLNFLILWTFIIFWCIFSANNFLCFYKFYLYNILDYSNAHRLSYNINVDILYFVLFQNIGWGQDVQNKFTSIFS